MFKICNLRNGFSLGIFYADLIMIKIFMGGNIHVLVNGSTQYSTRMFFIKHFQVRSSSNKADTKRGLGNYHGVNLIVLSQIAHILLEAGGRNRRPAFSYWSCLLPGVKCLPTMLGMLIICV